MPRSFIQIIVLFAFTTAACASASTPPPSPTSPATPRARTAILSELLNEVRARLSGESDFTAAAEGDVLSLGGQARTGAEGKVRIDLTEGTLIRLAPHSEFTLIELNADIENPVTKLALATGQLWVILSGGLLNVETPLGVVGVRGSYLSVAYYPEYQLLIVTCLEGSCELTNTFGATSLTTRQAASVNAEGQPPAAARPLTSSEYQAWATENPEAASLVPTPSSTGTPSGLPPGNGPGNTQPIHYTLRNNCPSTGGAWHVTFEGPVSVQVDVPVRETRTGLLPPGRYSQSDWTDDGLQHGPYLVEADLSLPLCPNFP